MNGALLLNKHSGISSFGMIELLQDELMNTRGIKRRDLPKMGHGGTLDPFATGLLIVLVGRAVKLARYFLGATKSYQGTMRFGETTVPGDPTAPISETSPHLPESLEALRDLAHRLTLQPYLQTPPMHSAKKRNGKPLYELIRAGIEVEREPKLCHLYRFDFSEYEAPLAKFELKCSSGTYVRTLAQDFARLHNSVALLDTLHRSSSGVFSVENAWTFEQVKEATQAGTSWDTLPCWISFDRLLDGYDRADATFEEKSALLQGKQEVLSNILQRVSPAQLKSSEKDHCLAIYFADSLIAVAREEKAVWGLERVFTSSLSLD